LIWFHVPGAFFIHLDTGETLFDFVTETMEMGSGMSEDEVKTRVLIEKKTVLNLIDAFSVSIKHYLRGEEGVLSMRSSTTFDP
jgi:hypothetical protein